MCGKDTSKVICEKGSGIHERHMGAASITAVADFRRKQVKEGEERSGDGRAGGEKEAEGEV